MAERLKARTKMKKPTNISQGSYVSPQGLQKAWNELSQLMGLGVVPPVLGNDRCVQETSLFLEEYFPETHQLLFPDLSKTDRAAKDLPDADGP